MVTDCLPGLSGTGGEVKLETGMPLHTNALDCSMPHEGPAQDALRDQRADS